MTQTVEIQIDTFEGNTMFGWIKTANAAGTTLRSIPTEKALEMIQWFAQLPNATRRVVDLRHLSGFLMEIITVEKG